MFCVESSAGAGTGVPRRAATQGFVSNYTMLSRESEVESWRRPVNPCDV